MSGKEWTCKHGIGHPYAKTYPDNVHGCCEGSCCNKVKAKKSVCPDCGTTMKDTGAPIWESFCPNMKCQPKTKWHLDYCGKCIQMTNHDRKNKCMKCGKHIVTFPTSFGFVSFEPGAFKLNKKRRKK
jgi:hypothetical protein